MEEVQSSWVLIMAGEKKIETSDSVAAILKSAPFTKLVEQDVVSGNGTPSILNSSMSSSGDATSGIKGETGQESAADQGVYYPPTSCYDYCYPGYNGNFSQLNDQNHFKAGDGSVLYYMPGYNPYATGPFMGVDGQQPYYSSTGYLQHPVSYGSEAMPCYTWNSTCIGDVANGSTGFPGKSKSAHGSNTSTKSNGYNSIKSSGTPASKFSTLPLDSKSRRSAASTNVSKSIPESQPFKTVGKLGSGYQSAGLDKGFHPVGKFSSYINHNQGLLMHHSPMSYRSNGRVWNGNNKSQSRDKHGEFDASTELTRGPRGQNRANPSNPSEEQLGPTVRRELYNLEQFQTEYDNAKFFVIKSYSEDDIHKCIKYDVWSSTPYGNKKLDAAFHDAEAKASETGTKCPVFLFFSVNGSGQFIGVAEMIGPVDFNKDMGFWQSDKWNGFFPVKWHVVKDTPNTQLHHIILENNDNKTVTFSRDTQEIGLKQGIEMLNIFKSYLAKSSILDDFNFYENREKFLKAKGRNKKASSQTEMYNNHDFPNHLETGERIIEAAVRPKRSDPTPSLINLTKNLSIKSYPLKSGAVKNPTENSVPPASASKAI
ncbi:YTH domain-containing protein ECT1-like isoform X6 [Actinidia eriantha]|uniref:YTH domain-containing protein ECT1-like isoform X6 n=1 Tax=Actinidia eriantha TaxID=165200 RepID=UPI0025845223|nr:YTH domain-containing protein ECT1-like isoform X6 [Actinidia eriantha]